MSTLPVEGQANQSSNKSPLLKGRTAIEDKLTFYLCERGSCQLPTTDIEGAIEKALKVTHLELSVNH